VEGSKGRLAEIIQHGDYPRLTLRIWDSMNPPGCNLPERTMTILDQLPIGKESVDPFPQILPPQHLNAVEERPGEGIEGIE